MICIAVNTVGDDDDDDENAAEDAINALTGVVESAEYLASETEGNTDDWRPTVTEIGKPE